MEFFFDPRGRIGRGAFWLGWLALWLAMIVMIWLPGVRFLAFAIITYSGVCIYAKRLRDMGRSVWTLAAPWAASLAAWVIIPAAVERQTAAVDDAVRDAGRMRIPTPGDVAAFAEGFTSSFAIAAIAIVGWIVFTLWVGLAQGRPDEGAVPLHSDGGQS